MSRILHVFKGLKDGKLVEELRRDDVMLETGAGESWPPLHIATYVDVEHFNEFRAKAEAWADKHGGVLPSAVLVAAPDANLPDDYADYVDDVVDPADVDELVARSHDAEALAFAVAMSKPRQPLTEEEILEAFGLAPAKSDLVERVTTWLFERSGKYASHLDDLSKRALAGLFAVTRPQMELAYLSGAGRGWRRHRATDDMPADSPQEAVDAEGMLDPELEEAMMELLEGRRIKVVADGCEYLLEERKCDIVVRSVEVGMDNRIDNFTVRWTVMKKGESRELSRSAVRGEVVIPLAEIEGISSPFNITY